MHDSDIDPSLGIVAAVHGASPPWDQLAERLRYVARGPYDPAVEFTLPSPFVPRLEVLRTYPPDYKLIFVGDAAMGPYELLQRGGSVEHNNDEPGQVWLGRLLAAYPSFVWLNPIPEGQWGFYNSVSLVKRLLEGRMFPLTLQGLDQAMRALGH